MIFYGSLLQPGIEAFDSLSTVSNFRCIVSKAFSPSISTLCVDPLCHPRMYLLRWHSVRKVSTHNRQYADNRNRIHWFFSCRYRLVLDSRTLRTHLEILSVSIGYYFVGSIADSIIVSYHMYASHLYCRQQPVLQTTQAIKIDTANRRFISTPIVVVKLLIEGAEHNTCHFHSSRRFINTQHF